MKPNPPSDASLNLSQDLSIGPVLSDAKLTLLMSLIAVADIPSRNQNAEFNILNRLFHTPHHYGALEQAKCFASLNRYSDVLPYKHNIAKLPAKPGQEPAYINGNLIHSPTQPGRKGEFIATQGPLDHTMEDFWTLVGTVQADYIVGVIESDAVPNRCSQYWPTKAPVHSGKWLIELISEKNDSFVRRRTLCVLDKTSSQRRQVTHLHLHNWKDYQAFDNTFYGSFLALMDEMWQYRHQGPKPPVIVHCSAGIGRTGTFIASYYLYEQWRQARDTGSPFKFSIFGLVRHLREQRHGAVQSFKQYQFLYDIVTHFK